VTDVREGQGREDCRHLREEHQHEEADQEHQQEGHEVLEDRTLFDAPDGADEDQANADGR